MRLSPCWGGVFTDPSRRHDATLRLHRLVQAVLQETLSEQERRAWIKHLIHLLNQAFPAESLCMGHWSWCEQLVPHITNGLIPYAQGVNPLDISSLLCKTASYLYHRTRYLEAVHSYQQVLDLREQMLGSEHPGLVEPLIGLTEVTWFLNNYSATQMYAQRVIGILERTEGRHHIALIKPLDMLAQVHRIQGQLREAEQLLRRALSIWVTTVLQEVSCLANPSDDVPNQKEGSPSAEMLIDQALALWEQIPQRHHIPIGQTLTALSYLYQQQQRYGEAEHILLPLYRMGKQTLGETHHLLARPLMILAKVYQEQERWMEAEYWYRQTLALRERALGPQHPQTVEARLTYAAFFHVPG